MNEGILGLSIGCCKDPACPNCKGNDWFIMSMNPFGMVDPGPGVQNPGEVGETVTYDLNEAGEAINVALKQF
jgi:hypothetical protein